MNLILFLFLTILFMFADFTFSVDRLRDASIIHAHPSEFIVTSFFVAHPKRTNRFPRFVKRFINDLLAQSNLSFELAIQITNNIRLFLLTLCYSLEGILLSLKSLFVVILHPQLLAKLTQSC